MLYYFATSENHFELLQAEWDVIKAIYKHILKLHHFDRLIDRSKVFLDFELMASKGKHKSPMWVHSSFIIL